MHGWPESKRIYWRVIEPLASAGFEVIVPDLRGFGDSGIAPDGFADVASHSRDLYALVHDVLGYERVPVLGGDLGGAVMQDLALRFPGWVDRMVIFNSPLPYLPERMAEIPSTRAPRSSADYFVRQGRHADELAAELATHEARRQYLSTFYSSRFWAHPDAFGADEIAFHVEALVDEQTFRASIGCYEAAFDAAARSEESMLGRNERTPALILFGTSDHVIYPSFDRMAAEVFARHVGPFLLRDCGHFVPWEAPHALTSGTIAFCGDLLARR